MKIENAFNRFPPECSNELTDALIRTGVTQEKIAKHVGCSQGFISRIRAGKHVPSAPIYYRLLILACTALKDTE